MTSALALVVLLSGASSATRPAGIHWEKDFDLALKKAKAAHKPLIVDFWADWCGWCHRLDRTTYVDPGVVKMAEAFVAVKVNTEGGGRETTVALRYDVTSLPTIAFLSPSGRPLLRLNGYQGPGQFPQALAAAKERADRIMGYEATLEQNPEDPVALAALGVHLFEQDAYAESRELLGRAARADGSRPLEERKETRLLLGAILKSDEKYRQAETVIKEALALPPSRAHDAKLLYVLGKLYLAWGRPDQARDALQQVISLHGESAIAAKARETLVALESK
jgi:thioredoxin-like negative regulator of GroEL